MERKICKRTIIIVAIEIQNLKKRYGQLEAIGGLSLSIPRGEFFGLLGPNGAGKTTLIKTIVGLCRATSGSIKIFGRDVSHDHLLTKREIGYSPQESNTDRYLSVRRTLEFQGGFYGLSRRQRRQRANELMLQFGLLEKAKTEFVQLSGGMQKRLLIARAMMNSPQILILDEPTAGVDVHQRRELWSYLRKLREGRTTLLLTTHYIEEAEALCDRVGIIHSGKIMELGSPQELIKRHCDPSKAEVVRGSLEEVFLKVTGASIYEDEFKERGKNGRLSDTP
jgi:ABC-2 type transport system ATP-binding protein